ncbi:MAG TPA: hypothetical protein VFS21_01995 [Roseiflexaceae bacterium]|nr:hypothetical protein [Roseiflexaceae bacterium]
MQNTVTKVLAVALVLNMGLNIALGLAVRQMRQDLAARPAQEQAVQQAVPPDQLAELQTKLERAEQDRIKATRDATSLRTQLNDLRGVAQDRDTIRGQVQQLQQENEQLRNQVTNLQSMNEINGQVTALRGLEPLRGVVRLFMNRTQLRESITAELSEELSPEEEQRQLDLLRALDMDGGITSLRDAQIDDFVKNVLGFYDQTTKNLVVITERRTMNVGDRITYAHEFAHNLQDQHFDLTKLFAGAEGNSDHQQALRALVEGDATLTMYAFSDTHLSAMEKLEHEAEQLRSYDVSGIFGGGGYNGPIVESASQFPYVEGAQFVAELYGQGGWAAVDRAFANPPRSTEQILHPEKYFRGEGPAQVGIPQLTAGLPGWQLVTEDTLGELYMRIYLEHQLAIAEAVPAAEGWGGDRYQVLRDGQGRLALALRTAWDTPADAREFFETYTRYASAQAQGQAGQNAGPGRLRWTLADRQIYLSLSGNQVLILRAPDASTIDAIVPQFQGVF